MKNFEIENNQVTTEDNVYSFKTVYDIYIKQNSKTNIDPVPDMDIEIDKYWDSKEDGVFTKVMTLIAALILTIGCVVLCYNKGKSNKEPGKQKTMTVIESLYSTPHFKGVEYTTALKSAIASGDVDIDKYNLLTSSSETESTARVLGDGKVYVSEIKYIKDENKHPENKGYWSYTIDYRV